MSNTLFPSLFFSVFLFFFSYDLACDSDSQLYFRLTEFHETHDVVSRHTTAIKASLMLK